MSAKTTHADIWRTSEAIDSFVERTLRLCQEVALGTPGDETMRIINGACAPDFDEGVLVLFGHAFAAKHQPSPPVNPLRHGEHVQTLQIARDAFFALQDAANDGRLDPQPVSPATMKVSKNKDRDDWIVEQSKAGRSLKEIVDDLPKQNRDWYPIHTAQGISAVLKRRGQN